MQLTDTVATLGVGSGDERVLFRLAERTLTAEVMPEHWARIEAQVQRAIDDGTLAGGMLAVGASRALRHLKRLYLGPHDLAVVDMAFDGRVLRVERHGLGDVFSFGRQRACAENTWYATLDVVGGCWSEGFEPEDARAFVERLQGLREARLRSLGYAAGVGVKVLAATAAAAGLAAAVAWTLRGPKKPGA